MLKFPFILLQTLIYNAYGENLLAEQIQIILNYTIGMAVSIHLSKKEGI